MRQLVLLVLLVASPLVFANCQCRCVNGSVQAICTSSIDVRPVCSPRVCQIRTPSVKPVQPPRVPPVGTKSCRQVQVLNEYTRRYEWKTVCR